MKLPEGKRVISCKWIFKRKEGIPSVESIRNKARFVVRGSDQEEGIEFNEVFSPVVCHTSIRILLALVTLYDLELEQLDMKTAFLHGNLEEEIYIDGSFIYFLLYVDDMLIAARDKYLVNKLKAQLSSEFDMKDLGPAKKILGIEINRDRQAGKLFLSQKKYVLKMLGKFGMRN